MAAAATIAKQLPSPSDIDAALVPYLSPPSSSDLSAQDGGAALDGQWRSVVLQILAYGTDYDVVGWGDKGAQSSAGSITTDEPLATRHVESAQCILDALSRFMDQLGKEKGLNNENEINAALDGPRSVLTDCLWLVGTMLEPTTSPVPKQQAPPPPSPRYDALCGLVNSITYGTSLQLPDTSSSASILPAVPIATLQKRLEPTLLAQSNLLPNRSTKLLIKRFTTANTNAYYRQVRFNLLREESEGWSKLLGLLCGLPGNVASADDAQVRIRELIGAFDLDPNRVLDVVVDILEAEVAAAVVESTGTSTVVAGNKRSIRDVLEDAPNHAAAVQIMIGIAAGLKVDSLPHLLGFKYANYAPRGGGGGGGGDGGAAADTTTAATAAAGTATTPKTLHLTTALLVLHGLVDPTKLIPHLSPSLDKLRGQYEDHQDAYLKRIKKMGTVSLNAAAAAEEKKDDGGGGDATAEGASAASGSDAAFDDNQIIRLFHALVEVGAPWDVATSIFASAGSSPDADDFDGAEAVCSLYEPAGRAVCSWVKKVHRTRLRGQGQKRWVGTDELELTQRRVERSKRVAFPWR